MKIDEMFLIGGSDINVGGVRVRQPRLDDIRSPHIGFEKYNAYLNVMAMTRDDLADGVFADAPPSLKAQLTVYAVVSVFPEFRKLAEESLSFFLGEPVAFDQEKAAFVSESGAVIGEENFDQVRSVILDISCIKGANVIPPKFPSEKARERYERMEKMRRAAAQRAKKTKKHDSDYDLPNLISALAAKHPSHNLLNIWDLTVWQFYNQFSRVCTNSQIDIVGLRWAAWGKDTFDFSTWFKHNE